MIQTKDGFYRDQFPMNIFLPLAIEVFRCLHQQEDGFLHQCANMAWGAKGTRSSHLLVLHSFYKQRVIVALQRAQVIFILKCAITIGESSSRLNILSRGPPLSLFDMFIAIGGGLGT
jgi:hypothetical protein